MKNEVSLVPWEQYVTGEQKQVTESVVHSVKKELGH